MKKNLVAVCFFSSFYAAAQHGIAMPHKFSVDYQKHKGRIELNNGEIISGVFQYASDEFPTYNLKYFEKNSKLNNRYRSSDIKIAALKGSDTTLTNKDSTYFKVLDKSKAFFRQLTFGKVEIYDKLFNVDEKKTLIRPPLLVRAESRSYEFNSSKKFVRWMKENYINKLNWHEGITEQEIIRQLNGIQ